MAVVAILRELWRHRLLVLLGVFVALAVQLLMVYRVSPGVPPKLESRQYDVGVASSAVLIDSQSSQVVDLGGGEVRTDVIALAARAKLLANLLATRPLRDDIARLAGVRPDRLITQVSSTTEEVKQPVSEEATGIVVRPDDADASILNLQTSETVPIITVTAQAPQEKVASRIASSTVATLRAYLTSVAATNRVPDVRQLVMRQLGEPTSATSGRGPDTTRAAMMFVLLLALWCAGILAMSGLSTAWREALVADQFAPELLPPDPEDEASAGIAPADIAEGPDHELRSVPPPETTSRVA
jgi:hypothetical protein